MKVLYQRTKTIFQSLLFILCAVATTAQSNPLEVDDLQIQLTSDWSLVQQARDHGKSLFVIENDSSHITLYSEKHELPDFETFFAENAETITPETMFNINAFSWRILEIRYRNELLSKNFYIFAFGTFFGGRSYYGYARSTVANLARKDGLNFLRLVQSK